MQHNSGEPIGICYFYWVNHTPGSAQEWELISASSSHLIVFFLMSPEMSEIQPSTSLVSKGWKSFVLQLCNMKWYVIFEVKSKQTNIGAVHRNNAFLLWLIQKALSEHSQNQHQKPASTFEILLLCISKTAKSSGITSHAMRRGLKVWRKCNFSFVQDSTRWWSPVISSVLRQWQRGGKDHSDLLSIPARGQNNPVLVRDDPALQMKCRPRMGLLPISANFWSLNCRRWCCRWLQAYVLSLNCKDT